MVALETDYLDDSRATSSQVLRIVRYHPAFDWLTYYTIHRTMNNLAIAHFLTAQWSMKLDGKGRSKLFFQTTEAGRDEAEKVRSVYEYASRYRNLPRLYDTGRIVE